MCTIVIEALTPLDRTSCIKMYKNNARSRLFCRIAKRSIKIGDWGERFVLVNGGCSSGKWQPRSVPVEVNNVNMEIATA